MNVKEKQQILLEPANVWHLYSKMTEIIHHILVKWIYYGQEWTLKLNLKARIDEKSLKKW